MVYRVAKAHRSHYINTYTNETKQAARDAILVLELSYHSSMMIVGHFELCQHSISHPLFDHVVLVLLSPPQLPPRLGERALELGDEVVRDFDASLASLIQGAVALVVSLLRLAMTIHWRVAAVFFTIQCHRSRAGREARC